MGARRGGGFGQGCPQGGQEAEREGRKRSSSSCVGWLIFQGGSNPRKKNVARRAEGVAACALIDNLWALLCFLGGMEGHGARWVYARRSLGEGRGAAAVLGAYRHARPIFALGEGGLGIFRRGFFSTVFFFSARSFFACAFFVLAFFLFCPTP